MPSTSDVFALRKEGKCDEALAMAAPILEASPNDIWAIRAFGWSCVDCIKKAQSTSDHDKAKSLFNRLKGLNVPDSDDFSSLRITRSKLALQLDESMAIVGKAEEAKKKGDHELELRFRRQACRQFPNDIQLLQSHGWAIYFALKDICSHEVPEKGRIVPLLQEYSKLTALHKMGLLHSQVLRLALIAASASEFMSFVHSWNLALLSEDDYKRGANDKKPDEPFPALAERLMKAINSWLKANSTGIDAIWLVPFSDKIMKRYSDNVWLPYYHGRLLIAVGDLDKARLMVMPLIRQKQSEFWAWDILGMTYAKDGDEGKQRSCLARALLCKAQKPEFLVNVRVHYAMFLKRDGLLSEARHELELIIKIREEQGWKIGADLQREINSEWYKSAQASSDNSALYSKDAEVASELAIVDLPWIDAIVSHRLPPKDGKKGLIIITTKGSSAERAEYKVKEHRYVSLDHCELGCPIRIKIEGSGLDAVVVAADVRPEGFPWDVLPAGRAVVTRIDEKAGYVEISTGRFVTRIHFDRYPEAAQLEVGSCIRVRGSISNKNPEKGPLLQVKHFYQGEPSDSEQMIVPYDGEIRVSANGAGFIDRHLKNAIYVPAEMIAKANARSGDRAWGNAVSFPDRKKNRTGMRAITFEYERIEPGSSFSEEDDEAGYTEPLVGAWTDTHPCAMVIEQPILTPHFLTDTDPQPKFIWKDRLLSVPQLLKGVLLHKGMGIEVNRVGMHLFRLFYDQSTPSIDKRILPIPFMVLASDLGYSEQSHTDLLAEISNLKGWATTRLIFNISVLVSDADCNKPILGFDHEVNDRDEWISYFMAASDCCGKLKD